MKKNIILSIVAMICSLVIMCCSINNPIIMGRVAGYMGVFFGGGIFFHHLCEILCDIFCNHIKDKGE